MSDPLTEVQGALSPLAGKPLRDGPVVVCGLHGVGLRIVELLHAAGQSVVVVDEAADDRSAQQVRAWDIPLLSENARRTETLRRAGAGNARAVICVENDDLHTLEIALLVHELNPDVRVVVRQANAAVGRAVADVTGPGTVLDVAELAGPAFVEAVLDRHTHELDIGGTGFVVAETVSTRAGTLRELYGDLGPVAVLGTDGSPAAICPSRDHPVAVGDRVTLVGPPRELMTHGVIPDPAALRRAASANRHTAGARGPRESKPGRDLARAGSTMSLIQAIVRGADRALIATVCAVGALIVIATGVLSIGYVDSSGRAMDGLDAVYFTIETLATVGYGDFAFDEQPAYLRIFAILLMIVGAGLVTILFAQITDLLVSRRLSTSVDVGRVGRMSGHVVVVGLGSVGMRVVEQLLADKRHVVVLENNPANVHAPAARALGAAVLGGSATSPATLASANLGAARGVAVLTSDDLVNIETALAVRDALGERADAVPVVVRLFDRQLARTVQHSFGFRHVRSTSALSAPWFVAAALGLEVLATFDVDSETLIVGRLHVDDAGALVGLAMSELPGDTRVLALGRRDGTLEFPPRRDTRFAPGDTAYVIGVSEHLVRVLTHDTVGTPDQSRSGSQEPTTTR